MTATDCEATFETFDATSDPSSQYLTERLRTGAPWLSSTTTSAEEESTIINATKILYYIQPIVNSIDPKTSSNSRRIDVGTIGEILHAVLNMQYLARFNEIELRFVKDLLCSDVGDFLRRNADTLSRNGSTTVEMERLVETCAKLKSSLRIVPNENNCEELHAIAIDIDKSQIREARDSTKQPLLYPLSENSVCMHIDRVKRLSAINGVCDRLKSLPRYNNDFQTGSEYDCTVVTGGGGGGGDCTEEEKVCSVSMDSIRAKLLNAYGRLSVIEPKLFVTRVQKIE